MFTAGIGRRSVTRCTQSLLSVTVYSARPTKRSLALYVHGRPCIVCMTARLDVMPKTTQQKRIVYTGKFEVEVTNNEKTALAVLYY